MEVLEAQWLQRRQGWDCPGPWEPAVPSSGMGLARKGELEELEQQAEVSPLQAVRADSDLRTCVDGRRAVMRQGSR